MWAVFAGRSISINYTFDMHQVCAETKPSARLCVVVFLSPWSTALGRLPCSIFAGVLAVVAQNGFGRTEFDEWTPCAVHRECYRADHHMDRLLIGRAMAAVSTGLSQFGASQGFLKFRVNVNVGTAFAVSFDKAL